MAGADVIVGLLGWGCRENVEVSWGMETGILDDGESKFKPGFMMFLCAGRLPKGTMCQGTIKGRSSPRIYSVL